eukprot:13694710-Ditylum_brightwellii.AAC.1
MTKDGKCIKWQNGVQNQQNSEPLPVLDPQIEGYKLVELFQWEMCVQFCHAACQQNTPCQMG